MIDLIERLAHGWVCLYTLGMRPRERAARRDEIASDLWEQRRDAAASGDSVLAAAVLWRVMAGMPSDLLWRVEAGGSAPGVTATGFSWRSQRGLQTVVVWCTAFLATALALIDSAGMPVLVFVALGVGGVLAVAGLMRAALGNPGEAITGSLEEDRMEVETYRNRRVRLLVVFGASVAIVLAIWAYAMSLDEWGGVRAIIFTVSGIVFPFIALCALVLQIADLFRMRKV